MCQYCNICLGLAVEKCKPDPPHNCRAFDVTISSLQVSCLPGDDGGLGQSFVLQVLEVSGSYEPIAEVRHDTASFFVANLRPATSYRLLVTAVNAKGKSRPAELQAYTVPLHHPQHENPAAFSSLFTDRQEPTRERESGAEVAVGVLAGAILACVPVAIIVVVIATRTCKRVRSAKQRGSEKKDNSKNDVCEMGGHSASVDEASGDIGSNITTITGGVYLSSTMAPTPSPPSPQHSHHHVPQLPVSKSSGTPCTGSQIYAQESNGYELENQVNIKSSSKMHLRPHVQSEKTRQGENELLEITLPPPAAYDQGYRSSPTIFPHQSVVSCYSSQEQGSPRAADIQGYLRQQGFQEWKPSGVQACYLPPPTSSVERLQSGPKGSSKINSSCNKSQVYRYHNLEYQADNRKLSGSASFATLPSKDKDINPQKVLSSQEGKMSTLYNPLALFPSSPSFQHKDGNSVIANDKSMLHTRSLKRPIKPSGQDIQRIRETSRNRSASVSTDKSKRESSV
ncbi:hypothetical protein SK128_007803 [Halocaridina rubra]|uniref:Fibronectin type-III domain-containing protein n=1 Tax=Halocaridina rubra TaxID=373956 RepID=A0AAN9A8M2_HALRR